MWTRPALPVCNRACTALMPGRVTNADAKEYQVYDWAEAGVYEYKLESVSISGAKETHDELAGPVAIDAFLAPIANLGVDAALNAVAQDSNAVFTRNAVEKLNALAAFTKNSAAVPAVAQGSPLNAHNSWLRLHHSKFQLRIKARNRYWLIDTSLFSARVVLTELSFTRMEKLTVMVALVSTAMPF